MELFKILLKYYYIYLTLRKDTRIINKNVYNKKLGGLRKPVTDY
jgi:hypothetical protein